MPLVREPATILMNSPAQSTLMNTGYRDVMNDLRGANGIIELSNGLVLGKFTTATRPANPPEGTQIWNEDLNLPEWFSGGGWITGASGGGGGGVGVSTSIIGDVIVESAVLPVAEKSIGTVLDGTTGAAFSLDATADSNLWDSADLTAMKLTRPIISATGTRETDDLPNTANGWIVEALVDDSVVDRVLIRRNDYSLQQEITNKVVDNATHDNLYRAYQEVAYDINSSANFLRLHYRVGNRIGDFTDVFVSAITELDAAAVGDAPTYNTSVAIHAQDIPTPFSDERSNVIYLGRTAANRLLIASNQTASFNISNLDIWEIRYRYAEINFGTSATALGDGTRSYKLQVRYAKVGSDSDQSLEETISFIGDDTVLPANSKVRIRYWDSASSAGVQSVAGQNGITSGGTAQSVTLQLDNEYVQDLVGNMLVDNTETGISVQYDDASGKINFVVDTTPTPATHSRYVFTSADLDFTNAELNSGNMSNTDTLTVPAFSSDQYLVFAIPTEEDDLTFISSGTLNQIDEFTKVTSPATLTAQNGDVVKLWRSTSVVFDTLSNSEWVIR